MFKRLALVPMNPVQVSDPETAKSWPKARWTHFAQVLQPIFESHGGKAEFYDIDPALKRAGYHFPNLSVLGEVCRIGGYAVRGRFVAPSMKTQKLLGV